MLALATLLLACGDDTRATDRGDADSGVADTSAADVSNTRGDAWSADAGDASADAPDDAAPALEPLAPGACTELQPGTWVITTLGLTRESPPGVVPGFDLDDRVSDGRDDSACNKPDQTSPDGLEGVDNQFATIIPLIENLGGAAIEAAVQDAINGGQTLFLLTIDDADDGCVGFSLTRAAGEPLVGTDGRILPWQTFDMDAAPVRVGCIDVDGCRLRPSGPEMPFQLSVLGTTVAFNLRDWQADFTLDEAGRFAGLIGGGVPLDDVFGIASNLTGCDQDLQDALRSLVPRTTDLFPDDSGECQAMSAALTFEAVPAFVFE